MTIQILKTFSTASTGDSFTVSSLQSGDVILWIWHGKDTSSFDGPSDFSNLTITPQAGGDPIEWSVITSPDDNIWYPWLDAETADYDANNYFDDWFYTQFWPLDGVTAGAYTLSFDLSGPDTLSVVAYGVILRNVDLENWPTFAEEIATSWKTDDPYSPPNSSDYPFTADPADISADADQAYALIWLGLTYAGDAASLDSIPAAYGEQIAEGRYYDIGVDAQQRAILFGAITAETSYAEPTWTYDPDGTALQADLLLIGALPGAGDNSKVDEPDTPDPGKRPYLPIGHNPPNVATNTEPTDTITIPDIDMPPDGAENLFLLLRLSVETLDGTEATAASYGAQALSRIGRIITGNDLEFVEIWGAAGVTPITDTDVVVTFDDLQAGIVAAANFCWNVDQLYPIAGFVSSTGSTSPHTIPISGSPYYLIFDAIAGDGTASYAPTPGASPTITQEYDYEAPDGSNELYDPTMRGSGGYADSQTTGTLSYTSEARVWAYGAIAMIPAGLPSDLPPFLDTDPNPDTPGDPPYSDPTDDPNAGDEAPATPAAIVTDCVFVECSDIAIHGMISNRLSITGNEITDYAAQAIVLDRTDASLIANNLISEGEYSAIIVGGAWRVSIMDNHIQDCAQAESGTSYAIDLSNCRHATIRGNRIVARVITPDYAIRIDNYCQQVAVIDNDCRSGYTSAAIGDTGIDTYAARNLPETALADLLADYMQIADYDADEDGIVDAAESVPWSGVTGAPTIPESLDDLTDVDAAAPDDGDLLQYNDGAGTWQAANPLADYLSLDAWAEILRQGFIDNAETGIAFNDSTYIFTLSDAGSGWSFYRQGYRFTVSGNKTVTLPGTPPATGHWFIYIDADDGTLSASQTAWTLTDGKVPVASIWWNSANTPKYLLADERHTALIDSRMQYYLHLAQGVAPITIPALSGYAVAPSSPATADNTFGIGAGAILDQDLLASLSALSDPGGTSADYMLLYRTAASTWTWAASLTPYRYITTGYVQWDDAGTMTPAAGNKYVNTYLILTNYAGAARFAFVAGRGEYSSLSAAQAEQPGGWTWSGLEIDEAVIAYRLTFYTSAAYSGVLGKCRLAATPQLIELAISGTAAQVGAGYLGDLADVDTTGASNGDALIYDGAAWTPQALPGGGDMLKSTYDTDADGMVDEAASVAWSGITGAPSIPAALDDLSDVDAAAPDDGQALIWSDGDGAWIPGDVSASAANVLYGHNWTGTTPNVSASAYSWKGNVYTCPVAIKLHGVQYCGNLVEGATYQAMVCTIDGSGTIQSVVASSATYTVTAGDDLTAARVWLRFAAAPTLTAATAYVAMIGRTDAADNYALPIQAATAVCSAPFGSTSGAAKYFRIADAAPAVSDTGEYATNNTPFVMGYLWEYV